MPAVAPRDERLDFPAPPAVPALPGAGLEAEPEEQEGTWRRLQAIFHRHQDKQAQDQGARSMSPAAADATAAAAGTPPAVQLRRERSPRPAPGRPVSDLPSSGLRRAAPSQPAQPVGEPHVEEPGAISPYVEPEPPAPEAAAAGEPFFEASEPKAAGQLPASQSDLGTEAAAPAGATPARTSPGQVAEEGFASASQMEGRGLLPEAPGPSELPAAPVRQRLPLEAVWPVQRLHDIPVPVRARPDAVPAGVWGQGSEWDAPAPVEGEPLGDRVEPPAPGHTRPLPGGSSPARPTASSVEILSPPRRRPEGTPAQGGPLPGPGRAPEPSALVPSDAPAPALEPGEPGEPGEIGEPDLPEQGGRRSPIQRTPHPTGTHRTRPGAGQEPFHARPPAGGSEEQDVIETEIGPLPADLWRLIGEEPAGRPLSAPAERRPAGETAARTEASAAEVRSVPPAPPVRPREPAPREASTEVIQRRPDEAGATAGPAGEAETAGSVAGPAAQSAAKGAAGLDVDELACRVYAEIKRRLAVERERVRLRP